MLFLNPEFAFEKLFDTAEISMFWQFCSQSGSNFDQPVAIKSCEVSAKVACVCPCTQENLEFLANKSKCIVYFNKMFGWKNLFVHCSVYFT